MSRPQAVLLDFYGTVVEEDDQQIRQICVEISDTSSQPVDPHTVGSYWSDLFSHLCTVSVGPSFATQRALERQSLQETILHFGSVADEETLSKQMFAYWRQPTLFQEATAFLSEIAQPVCIVSDIDRADIEAAISHHGIGVDLIVTSEDARAYKPRPEPFRLALGRLGLQPDQVLHIGNSPSCDVAGATSLGIPVAWLNRKGKERPQQTHVAYEAPNLLAIHRILADAVD
ncbi:HAD family hydrolase [Frankia sp. AiPs1]|uniref:HAD family hydrolase n=1 Tax=Frankia sp. AiPs1 TaxID=573493 RepID=UPI0020444D54|nr:HAD family hydrolase [Frankia sp. AiPs1]MCM3921761.1 HAD family hydrolase [Frankia sp. AiPs1]